jgi:hypothetical protein
MGGTCRRFGTQTAFREGNHSKKEQGGAIENHLFDAERHATDIELCSLPSIDPPPQTLASKPPGWTHGSFVGGVFPSSMGAITLPFSSF